jgi:hypothetical protein
MRSRFAWLEHLYCGPCSLSAAVAHLILVRRCSRIAMNLDTLLPAITTGAFGLVTGLAVAYKDELKSFLVRGTRRVDGVWRGTGQDIQLPNLPPLKHPESYTIDCTFKQRGRRVTAQHAARGELTYHITMSGTLRRDFLQLNYTFNDSNSTGGGVMLLELI